MTPKCPYCQRSWIKKSSEDGAVWCVNGHWWFNDATYIDRLKEVLQWSF